MFARLAVRTLSNLSIVNFDYFESGTLVLIVLFPGHCTFSDFYTRRDKYP